MENKVRILIIEDDEDEALFLKEYLERKNFLVIAIESSIKGALETFSLKLIDLVIIDIYLNGKPDGITIAEKISENKELVRPFIFLTGSSEKHIFDKAKLTQPFSYLLKPFNELELEYAIELSIEKYNTQLNQLKAPKKLPFFIKQKDVFLKLTFEEILYIEVEGRYCKIISNDKSFLLQYSLNELTSYLPSEDFIKIHRNFVINNNFTEKVYLKDNLLCLKNNITIPIGRAYKEYFLQRYKVFRK